MITRVLPASAGYKWIGSGIILFWRNLATLFMWATLVWVGSHLVKLNVLDRIFTWILMKQQISAANRPYIIEYYGSMIVFCAFVVFLIASLIFAISALDNKERIDFIKLFQSLKQAKLKLLAVSIILVIIVGCTGAIIFWGLANVIQKALYEISMSSLAFYIRECFSILMFMLLVLPASIVLHYAIFLCTLKNYSIESAVSLGARAYLKNWKAFLVAFFIIVAATEIIRIMPFLTDSLLLKIFGIECDIHCFPSSLFSGILFEANPIIILCVMFFTFIQISAFAILIASCYYSYKTVFLEQPSAHQEHNGVIAASLRENIL